MHSATKLHFIHYAVFEVYLPDTITSLNEQLF